MLSHPVAPLPINTLVLQRQHKYTTVYPTNTVPCGSPPRLVRLIRQQINEKRSSGEQGKLREKKIIPLKKKKKKDWAYQRQRIHCEYTDQPRV